MTHKIDRLELIRERHRKLILEPRRREQFGLFEDDWVDEEYDFVDEELLTRQFRGDDQDDE